MFVCKLIVGALAGKAEYLAMKMQWIHRPLPG
jgi:hypothetical protein